MSQGTVIQYKCQNCGADMAFDANSGKLKCPSCGREDEITNIQSNGSFRPSEDHVHVQATTGSEDDMVQYQCQNCGAVVITNSNTSATRCSFCNAPVILGERLEGVMKPDYVIPFKIDRAEADSAFRKWTRMLRFAPKDFRKAMKVKKVEGLYAPFWLYDVCGQGDAVAECTRSKVYHRGDYRITETSHYEVYRQIDTTYEGVPADASLRMEDHLMDLMEPFDYSNMQPFSTPYLTGYVAENYDYDAEQMFPRAKERVFHYMDDYVKRTINGYNTTVITRKNYRANRDRTFYCLFPIWMSYATYKDKDYSFAMNGETGKIAGKPPISWSTVFGYIFGTTFGVFLLVRLIILLTGGPFLW
ncbi:MAG: hypothetical protein IJ065_12250 [Eubacterium sp.]|nr:hypothetical protein [Eubacterium sp.]